MKTFRVSLLLAVALFCAGHLFAQEPYPSTLTLKRIFTDREFQPERFGPARWLEDGTHLPDSVHHVPHSSVFLSNSPLPPSHSAF